MIEKETSAQQMSFQCEGLCTLSVANALHVTLALPCGLMAILRSVVDTGRSLDEHIFTLSSSGMSAFAAK
ncbi:hypothetical protein HR51_21465 [Burkholderia cepacia]|nr:hypothetical protein HR51_21465 [Burkholderia cepacia]